MAWLQIDQTIRDHHKILDAADQLETTDAHVTGCLVLLWLWAIDNAPDGSLAGISDATIARAARWSGERTAFIEALTDVGLLDRTPEGLAIHDWQDRAGNLIDRRRADAERKRRERAEKKAREASENSRDRPAGHLSDVRTQSRVNQSTEKEEHSRAEGGDPPTPPATDGKSSATLQDERFDQFWEAYPRKVGKADARKAWKKAKITAEIFEKIMTAIAASKESDQWQREAGRYIPNPSTWINQGRWDDEPIEVSQSAVKPFDAMTVLKGIMAEEEPQTSSNRGTKYSALDHLRRMAAEEDDGQIPGSVPHYTE